MEYFECRYRYVLRLVYAFVLSVLIPLCSFFFSIVTDLAFESTTFTTLVLYNTL
jgi:hypothetical protein